MGTALSRILATVLDYRDQLIRHDVFIYKLAAGFFHSLFILGIIYRLRIHYMLKVDTAFMISETPTLLLFRGLLNEILFSFISAVILWGIFTLINVIRKREPGRLSEIIFSGIAASLVLGIVFVYNSSYHFWVSMNTGLTRDLFLEGVSTTSFSEAVKFVDAIDVVSIFAVIVGLLLFLAGRTINLWRGRIISITVFSIFIIFIMYSFFAQTAVGGKISQPPVLYTINSFFDKANWQASDSAMDPDHLSAAQMQSVQLIDSRFVDHMVNSQNSIQYTSGKKWNVLYIILESTGKEYVFNTKLGNPVPMPFLKKLSKESLFLDYHFSTGNTSPRSIYSMLSGMYPSPRVKMFCTRDDVVIPSLASFLGNSYDSFLVTPGSLSWFFPQGFMKNSGFKDILGYEQIPARITRDGIGKDELETLDFFLKRLDKAADKPFLAIYYSFICHWPYLDYGPEYRVFPQTHNRLNRYYNNLRLLDSIIEKIYTHLKNTNKLDNTIIVIAGDHSEAFGQHFDNWCHARQSYNENFRVPALIYQPKLFAPKTIPYATTHADILPTLLDAMGIEFNRKLIQGESLLQKRLRRKYIFLYGNENTITSVSNNNIKVQHSF
ncbi:MAG TPA: LTA synthase family protein, partial [Spirochaetota bacterium]|nr:LTA synthase family protein [Spirochaetota bacterium]